MEGSILGDGLCRLSRGADIYQNSFSLQPLCSQLIVMIAPGGGIRNGSPWGGLDCHGSEKELVESKNALPLGGMAQRGDGIREDRIDVPLRMRRCWLGANQFLPPIESSEPHACDFAEHCFRPDRGQVIVNPFTVCEIPSEKADDHPCRRRCCASSMRAKRTWSFTAASASKTMMTLRPFHVIQSKSRIGPLTFSRWPSGAVALPTVPRQLKTPEMPTGRKRGSFCTPNFASRQSARVLNSPSVMINGRSALTKQLVITTAWRQVKHVAPAWRAQVLLFDLQLATRIRFQIRVVASQSVLTDMPVARCKVRDSDTGVIASFPSDELCSGPRIDAPQEGGFGQWPVHPPGL